MPEWRNWQTRQVEGLVAFTGSAGSSPVSGMLQRKGLRRIGVNPFFVPGTLVVSFWCQRSVCGANASIVLNPIILREGVVMAFVEKRGEWYRVVFRHAGKRYTHTLKTKAQDVADGILGGVQKTLMLLDQRVLHLPEGADVLAFVLSGGQ